METWIQDKDSISDFLVGYKCYSKKARKLKQHGRASGGIAVYIKETLAQFVRGIEVDFHHGIFLHFDREVFGEDLIFGTIYLPPEYSNAYDVDEATGIQQLEDIVEDITITEQNSKFIISGDFNARTNILDDYNSTENDRFLPGQDHYGSDPFDCRRSSKDKAEANVFGQGLIALCKKLDLHIVNGRKVGDEEGEFTCYTPRGCSVIDYTLAATPLFPQIEHFSIGMNDKYTHLSQNFVISKHLTDEDNEIYTETGKEQIRYKWTEDAIANNIQNETSRIYIEKFNQKLDASDPVGASQTLTELIHIHPLRGGRSHIKREQ